MCNNPKLSAEQIEEVLEKARIFKDTYEPGYEIYYTEEQIEMQKYCQALHQLEGEVEDAKKMNSNHHDVNNRLMNEIDGVRTDNKKMYETLKEAKRISNFKSGWWCQPITKKSMLSGWAQLNSKIQETLDSISQQYDD